MDASDDGLRELLSSAFDEYKKCVGVDLRNPINCPELDPFLGCTTTTQIQEEFEKSVEALADFRMKKDRKIWKRVLRKFDGFIRVLLLFNDAIAELASSLNAPGGKAIFVAFHVLLKATRANDERLEEISVLLSKLQSFFERLSVYLKIPHWEKCLRNTLVKMLVLVFESLAIATAQMRRGRLGRMKDALLGNEDLEMTLQKFETHVSQENSMVSAWTFSMVGNIHEVVVQVDPASFGASKEPALLASSEPSIEVKQLPDAQDQSLARLVSLFPGVVVVTAVCLGNETTCMALATGFLLCWLSGTFFSIPRAVLGKVHFMDAFGDEFSIDLSSCSTPESFREFLLKMSDREAKKASRSFVVANEYHIKDSDNGGVIPPESWTIEAHMRIEMAIIVTTKESICPSCKRVVSSASKVFECCGRQFSMTTVFESVPPPFMPMAPEHEVFVEDWTHLPEAERSARQRQRAKEELAQRDVRCFKKLHFSVVLPVHSSNSENGSEGNGLKKRASLKNLQPSPTTFGRNEVLNAWLQHNRNHVLTFRDSHAAGRWTSHVYINDILHGTGIGYSKSAAHESASIWVLVSLGLIHAPTSQPVP